VRRDLMMLGRVSCVVGGMEGEGERDVQVDDDVEGRVVWCGFGEG
jgi:hypothetical protein